MKTWHAIYRMPCFHILVFSNTIRGVILRSSALKQSKWYDIKHAFRQLQAYNLLPTYEMFLFLTEKTLPSALFIIFC